MLDSQKPMLSDIKTYFPFNDEDRQKFEDLAQSLGLNAMHTDSTATVETDWKTWTHIIDVMAGIHVQRENESAKAERVERDSDASL